MGKISRKINELSIDIVDKLLEYKGLSTKQHLIFWNCSVDPERIEGY